MLRMSSVNDKAGMLIKERGLPLYLFDCTLGCRRLFGLVAGCCLSTLCSLFHSWRRQVFCDLRFPHGDWIASAHVHEGGDCSSMGRPGQALEAHGSLCCSKRPCLLDKGQAMRSEAIEDKCCPDLCLPC